MKRAVFVFGVVCLFATLALGEPPQFSVGYVYQGSQPVPGSDWFGLSGARADVTWPVTPRWSTVGEFSGVHAESYGSSGSPLTLLTFMAGPRFSWPVRSREAGRVVPFAQVLLGGAHATVGLFPQGQSLKTTATSFAMSAGGGLQIGLRPGVSLRLIQVDYLYLRMPNLYDQWQKSFRIGAGVVFQLR
jgi:peptidoglycan-associated lipoprotein